MEKATLKKAREDFALHTMLIMRDGVSKTVAQAQAYAETTTGLDKRLGQQRMLSVVGE